MYSVQWGKRGVRVRGQDSGMHPPLSPIPGLTYTGKFMTFLPFKIYHWHVQCCEHHTIDLTWELNLLGTGHKFGGGVYKMGKSRVCT